MVKFPVHCDELFVMAILFLAAIPVSGSQEDRPKPAVTSSSVTHLDFKSPKPFAAVTAAIEKQLGKFDPEIDRSLSTAPANPDEIESRIRAMEGSSGLMLFAVRDHGRLLGLRGKEVSARQYEIGNPLVALEMTQEDIRAGEYAPVRIYVYGGEDDLTHVDYDLPSSLFGGFKSARVDQVAKGLDQKVETLIMNALKN